ncbi:helix-turn-helix transcriptional regulator [Arthrobacter sp. NPDC092385]|uniref:helix-turn-helix transcriptional regulator n=1 Tax=Arthrobacter sp. NPDC092385 TaxID=3363943 RepID=UPI003822D5CF
MSTTISISRPTLISIAERLAAVERDVNSARVPVLDSLLTPPALAEQLGVTERALSEWRITGRGPAFIRLGKTVRYRSATVESWLLSQEHHSTSEEVRY